MITRRDVFTLLAGGAVAASGLLLPERTIFLPPHGGWVVTQKRMDFPIHYAHIWQQELDSGVVTFVHNADHPIDGAGDRLQLWTSAPLESQPLKDWRQFVSDWRKERGMDMAWLKEVPAKPDSKADAIANAFRFSSSEMAAASESISVRAASRRTEEIRAQMAIDQKANRERIIALYRDSGRQIPERYLE